MNDPKTNLGKRKSQVILDLLMSINQGNSYYVSGEKDCIWYAHYQYNRLVEEGIIEEVGN